MLRRSGGADLSRFFRVDALGLVRETPLLSQLIDTFLLGAPALRPEIMASVPARSGRRHVTPTSPSRGIFAVFS
jgi:hypothetical protein